MRNRTRLLDWVLSGPIDDDILGDTKQNWFQSLPMWLYMQSYISNYHDRVQDPNNYPDEIELPVIKNLSVIPICGHMRKPVHIDADVLYRMMSETKNPARDEFGRVVNVGYVTSRKEHYFNEIFNMAKIDRVLKGNKKFHHYVLCDGVSVSILYKVPKATIDELVNNDLVKQQYYDGHFVYELGIDPGMKTWNATVRRHIDSNKEVCSWFLNTLYSFDSFWIIPLFFVLIPFFEIDEFQDQ